MVDDHVQLIIDVVDEVCLALDAECLLEVSNEDEENDTERDRK
jgi:hypothetical protein